MMEWHLTAGDVLIAISLIVSVFGGYNRLSNKLEKIKTELDLIKDWWIRCIEGKCPMAEHLKHELHNTIVPLIKKAVPEREYD
jgi:hypothetical protein